jgi:hypothetical protein
MKLVKESLNRFERGIDPKHALGIGPRVTAIRKCFRDLGVSDDRYEITSDKVIFLSNDSLDLNDTDVSWLPNGLKIIDSLFLGNTPIAELPTDLKVGGSLDLRRTQVTELPEGLEVDDYIYVNEYQKDLIAFIKGTVFAYNLRVLR